MGNDEATQSQARRVNTNAIDGRRKIGLAKARCCACAWVCLAAKRKGFKEAKKDEESC